MGLDTYAQRSPDEDPSPEDREAFRSADVALCECQGDTSFRGKIYVSLVLEATGVGLTQEWIPPEVVRRMAASLESIDPVAAVVGEPRVEPWEVLELRRFFRLCAERDLGLVGSW